MTIDLLPFGCFFSDVAYFWCDSPLLFPRPRIESNGLVATGGITSIPSIPKLYLHFLCHRLLKEFARQIYLRSTKFVSVPTLRNGCLGLIIRRKFRAGAQIGRDTNLRGKKSLSTRRVRQLRASCVNPRLERVHF